jgi:hypothetical protein
MIKRIKNAVSAAWQKSRLTQRQERRLRLACVALITGLVITLPRHAGATGGLFPTAPTMTSPELTLSQPYIVDGMALLGLGASVYIVIRGVKMIIHLGAKGMAKLTGV